MPNKFFLLIPLLLVSFDQTKLVKTKIGNDITIFVPREWKPMDELDFSERYPSVRAPLAAYTNEDRTVDFSVNISATRWPDSNLEIAKQFFRSGLSNLIDRVDMLDEGIRELNGKQFIFFEFESRVNGNRTELGNADPVLRYTYLQYLIEPDRTLVFSFNCPRRERPAWEDVAEEMMKRIKVK